MENSELSKNLFKYTVENNINEVKSLINDSKLSVNCYDEQGMTPLQHAAFKGYYDLCKLLLDCGADVNDNNGAYGYSALSLAAISNHCSVVSLLLEYGAESTAINKNNRTAAQVAAFVGNHKSVSIINNYVPKSVITYFTEVHGMDPDPKLPMFLVEPVHKLVVMPTIHPVELVLYVQSHPVILKHFGPIIDVLNILAEKQLKTECNERMSLKLHHFSFVLRSANDYIVSHNTEGGEEIKVLNRLIRSLLEGSDNAGISVSLEKYLRKSISAYPFRDCLLFQHIVTTVSGTEVGNEPNSLIILSNAVIGHRMQDIESCATCGAQSDSAKMCSGCKKAYYCNQTCQKLHWFVHRNTCKL